VYGCRSGSRKSSKLHLSETINKIDSFLLETIKNNTNYEMKEGTSEINV